MSKVEGQWYVIQTYTGYEDKVSSEIMTRASNMGLDSFIEDVKVLREDVEEITKDGRKRIVNKKIYLGYIFVKMVLTDDTWRIFSGIRGCSGFALNSSKPTPLPPSEVKRLFGGKSSKQRVVVPYKVGDNVQIIDGPLGGYVGCVDVINLDKKVLTVRILMFGRETNVELNLDEVELIIK